MQIRKAKVEDVESMVECMRLASEDSSKGDADTVNTRQQLTDSLTSNKTFFRTINRLGGIDFRF